ncbi:MAG: hypothetical protein J6X18_10750 [Bacteroidales bacterium]|nr:hypothetical protein [Bacteroidales bacterium]
MKKLTKKQKQLADKAIAILSKLYEEGVWAMVIDGGGGREGLTFWRPTDEENCYAYEIVAHQHELSDEFWNEKSYTPSKSIGLPIDTICP